MSKMEDTRAKTHYGFALLRAWMCFVVVLSHFWEPTGDLPFALRLLADMRPLAVPVFMTTSFFFVGKYLFDIRPDTLTKRLWRLLWPHFAWTLVYWIIYFPFGFAGVKDLLWQLLTGHSLSLNPTMWFQVVMVWLFLVYYAIFRLLKTGKAVALCICLGVLALLLQHSGVNYRVFSPLRYELTYPLGRFVEMLPYGALGVSVAYFCQEKPFTARRCVWVGAGVAMLILALVMEKAALLPVEGFGYAGVLLLLKTAGVFCAAWSFPLWNLPEKAKKILEYVTAYTLGVYCMHRLAHRLIWAVMGRVLESILGISMLSIPICVIVYAACYVCSAIAARLRVKPITQMVQ